MNTHRSYSGSMPRVMSAMDSHLEDPLRGMAENPFEIMQSQANMKWKEGLHKSDNKLNRRKTVIDMPFTARANFNVTSDL